MEIHINKEKHTQEGRTLAPFRNNCWQNNRFSWCDHVAPARTMVAPPANPQREPI